MARGLSLNASPRDIAAIDLSRVLARIEQQLVSPEGQLQLRHSHLLRTKATANLEYARTLLLRLEHDASNLKIQSQRAAAQTFTSQQRHAIKQLTSQLQELEEVGDDSDLTQGPVDTDSIFAPAVTAPQPNGQANDNASESKNNQDTPDINIPSGLRVRHPQPSHPNNDSLANQTGFQPTPNSPPTNSSITRLEANDTETTNLTTSLLSLAQALRASSAQFSDSLDADNAALRRATEGLDKSETSMDRASKNMGLLRRMSEGKGWWGRIMLYAWIGGLWVLALAVVFVLPKLRF